MSDTPEPRNTGRDTQTSAPSGLAAAPAVQKRQGLAITSLVLGVVSLFTGLVAGVPAVITGHLARYRAAKSPTTYGGGGMAVAGLIMGYVTTVLSVWLLINISQAKQRAQGLQCINHLKQIGLAARMWGNDHDDILPPDFASMSNELNLVKLLVCPKDSSKVPAKSWADVTAQNVSYVYLTPGLSDSAVANRPVFKCPLHGYSILGNGDLGPTLPSGARSDR